MALGEDFAELSEAVRDVTAAMRDFAGALEQGGAAGGGEGGTGVGRRATGGRGSSALDRIGGQARGAFTGIADQAIGPGFNVGVDAGLGGAQLAAAKLAGDIPILGQLSGFSRFGNVVEAQQSALQPLRDLAAAGINVQDDTIQQTVEIAGQRQRRVQALEDRAVGFISGSQAGQDALGEAPLAQAITKLINLGERVATAVENLNPLGGDP